MNGFGLPSLIFNKLNPSQQSDAQIRNQQKQELFSTMLNSVPIKTNGNIASHTSSMNSQTQSERNYGSIPQNTKNLFAQKDPFRCSCGYEVSQKQIQSHFSSCPKFQEKYQGLFHSIENEISENKNDDLQLRNIKSLLSFFID